MSSLVSRSVSRRRHAGPRNTHAICEAHISEYGARPDPSGLKGEARKSALQARAQWDSALKARSPVIAQGVSNDVIAIADNGYVVPVRRRA